MDNSDARHPGEARSVAPFSEVHWEDQVALFAIVKLDGDGLVRGWNTGAEVLKRYRADEIIGSHFSRFYRQSDRDRNLPDTLLAIARSEGSAEDTGWRVRGDGTEFWARVTITAVRDAEGETAGFVKIVRDLTDEKEAADERAALQRTFAHDLMSPVTALSGYLELLEDELGADHRLLGMATQVSEHLIAMANALMADAAAGAVGPHRVLAADLIVRSAALLVMREDANSRISFARMQSVQVRGDALALRRAFANVIENAAKYSDGPIEVSVEASGGRAVVRIADRGRGIDPRDLASIMSEGERGRLADPDDGGRGIGLASVTRIMAEHDGSFELDSTLGEGTVATLTLPAVD